MRWHHIYKNKKIYNHLVEYTHMKPYENLHIQKCNADTSEYLLSYYVRDYKQYKIDKWLSEQNFKVVDEEQIEGGEHITLFLNKK